MVMAVALGLLTQIGLDLYRPHLPAGRPGGRSRGLRRAVWQAIARTSFLENISPMQ